MRDQHTLDEIRRSYSILGVAETASPEEIRRRYLLLAKEWHPDKSKGDPLAEWRATEKMKRLNEAFARIKDAPLRSDPASPAPGAHTIPPDSSNDPPGSRAGNVTVFITSDALTSSDLLIAGWIGRRCRISASFRSTAAPTLLMAGSRGS
jgi:curved DNA-binding protein CbpA